MRTFILLHNTLNLLNFLRGAQMATETFYERRLRELQGKKEEKMNSNPLLQRPKNTIKDTVMAKQLDPQQPQVDDENPLSEYKDTHFYKNVERFKNEDPKFGSIMESYTQLAMALKDQVDSGFMPLPIAQQRLSQFLTDHRQGYKKPSGEVSPEAGAMGQVMSQNAAQVDTGGLNGTV